MSTKNSCYKATSFTNRSDELFNFYLKEVRRHKRLTPEESHELLVAMHAGGPEALAARNRFVEGNLRYVVSVAKNYNHPILSIMDLIQLGNEGLVHAVETFDEALGFQFASYADKIIRHAIEKGLDDFSAAVTQSQLQTQIVRDYKRMNEQMLQSKHRILSIEEYCEISDNKYDTVVKALAAAKRYESLDAPTNLYSDEDDVLTLGDTLSCSTRCDAELDKESISLDIQDILSKVLNDKEQFVINNLYGLKGKNRYIDDLAKTLAVSEDRVRQIHIKAVKKLKQASCGDRLIACFAA